MNDIPPINLIVAGESGTGKTTLIEAAFKEKAIVYSINEAHTLISGTDSICVWETMGWEINFGDYETNNETILNTIRDTVLNNHVQAVWYIINSNSRHFSIPERYVISCLYKIGIPMILVMTQCFSEEGDKEYEDAIRRCLEENGITDLPIIQVLALEKVFKHPVTKERIVIPAMGVDDLIKLTIEMTMPR